MCKLFRWTSNSTRNCPNRGKFKQLYWTHCEREISKGTVFKQNQQSFPTPTSHGSWLYDETLVSKTFWATKRFVCQKRRFSLWLNVGKLFTEFHDLYIVNLMTNKIGIFLQAALRNQSRTLKNFILKCLPSLWGLTMEPTTKILHFCYRCLTFLHLQWYRFLVSEILSRPERKNKARWALCYIKILT